MKFSKKNILVSATIVVLIVVGFMTKEYFRIPEDITSMSPTTTATAADIVELYANDESKANKLFLDKAIQIHGPVVEIINQRDTLINVFLGDTNALHKVSCLLDRRHLDAIKGYTAGKQITIKGICTGFLVDVELNRCVIVDSNEQ